MQWLRMHENDPRTLMPKVQEQVTVRREFSEQYGKRHAATFLAQANDAKAANVRRMRAVAVGLATIKDKLETDPLYSPKQAATDAATLRAEYVRLRVGPGPDRGQGGGRPRDRPRPNHLGREALRAVPDAR